VKSSSLFFEIFLHSQLASHIAAGALLFSQLLMIECPLEVQPSHMMLSSALSIINDISNISVICPFNYGALDGLFMLLNQMLDQVHNQFSK
jgi:fused-like protein